MSLKEEPTVNYDLDESENTNPVELVDVLRRRWIALVVTLIVVTSIGALYTKTRRKVYTSGASMVVSTQASMGGGGGASSILESIASLTNSSSAQTQAAIISSPDLLRAAFDRMSEKEKLRLYGEGAKGIPDWGFDVDQKKDTDVISITVRSYNAVLSAKLANAIIATYLDDDQRRNTEAATKARQYVQSQLTEIKGQLMGSAKELAAFQESHKFIDPLSQNQAAIKLITDSRSAADKAMVAAMGDARNVSVLESEIHKLAPEVRLGQVVAENPDYGQERTRISTLQGQLVTTKQTFQPDSPEVKNLERQIANEEELLRKLTHTIVTSQTSARNPSLDKLLDAYGIATAQKAVDEANSVSLRNLVAQHEKALDVLPKNNYQFAALQEEVVNKGKTYDLLTQKYYEFYIEENSKIPHGFAIATAAPPSVPSSISMARGIAVSVLLGLILGAFAAGLFERLDTRIHEPATAEKLSGLTMLTAVPETKSTEGSKSVIIGTVTEGASGFIESYRLLRNNITFAAADKDMRILAVTSAGKAEGKSTTALNLAIAMGMDGKRVLLIDADLRRPALHTYIGVSREIGLTNVAKGMIPLDQAVVKTPYEGVTCLLSGPLPPNPTEFLNSRHVRALVEQAAAEYDMVIIDSPPCTGLSDVQVVSTLVDGVLLVVALDTTQKHYLGAAVRLLRLAKAPTIGMVLNRVRYNRTSYYYSYYYYYGYYGEDEESGTKKRKGRKKPPNRGTGA